MWSYSSETCIKTARDVKEPVYKKCHPQESRCWQDNINTSVAMISQWWLFVDVDVSIDQGCGGGGSVSCLQVWGVIMMAVADEHVSLRQVLEGGTAAGRVCRYCGL